MGQQLYQHTLSNGLVLLAEAMPWVESAAFSLLLPAGCQSDPDSLGGLSSLTCEMAQRGCGKRTSRQFVEDLENLGVDASAGVSVSHSSFGGAMVADKLPEVLGIYADLVRRAHLPEDELEDARALCLQEVRALEDDLAAKTRQKLRQLTYPDPLGRSAQGTQASLEAITHEAVQRHYQRSYSPRGAVLSVAGNIEWARLVARVEELFGDWEGDEAAPAVERPAQGNRHHITQESSQTHIAVSYPSVPYSHPDYFQARGAVGVLSDGFSARLFIEVREKRGLCYSVGASLHSLKDRASVMAYSSTSSQRAQETLDVLLAELARLGDGIEPDELRRLKAQIKSSLVMQQESSGARAGAMAGDWYFLGRVRTLEEVGRKIDELTCESINAYLARNRPGNFTVVTLGGAELEVRGGIS